MDDMKIAVRMVFGNMTIPQPPRAEVAGGMGWDGSWGTVLFANMIAPLCIYIYLIKVFNYPNLNNYKTK